MCMRSNCSLLKAGRFDNQSVTSQEANNAIFCNCCNVKTIMEVATAYDHLNIEDE